MTVLAPIRLLLRKRLGGALACAAATVLAHSGSLAEPAWFGAPGAAASAPAIRPVQDIIGKQTITDNFRWMETNPQDLDGVSSRTNHDRHQSH